MRREGGGGAEDGGVESMQNEVRGWRGSGGRRGGEHAERGERGFERDLPSFLPDAQSHFPFTSYSALYPPPPAGYPNHFILSPLIHSPSFPMQDLAESREELVQLQCLIEPCPTLPPLTIRILPSPGRSWVDCSASSSASGRPAAIHPPHSPLWLQCKPPSCRPGGMGGADSACGSDNPWSIRIPVRHLN